MEIFRKSLVDKKYAYGSDEETWKSSQFV